MPSLPVTEKMRLPMTLPMPISGTPELDRPHGEEEILDGQHGGDDRGAEHRALDGVAVEDLVGALADGRGADDDAADRERSPGRG